MEDRGSGTKPTGLGSDGRSYTIYKERTCGASTVIAILINGRERRPRVRRLSREHTSGMLRLDTKPQLPLLFEVLYILLHGIEFLVPSKVFRNHKYRQIVAEPRARA